MQDSSSNPQPAGRAMLRRSALETAADRGIGPLSDLARQAWHGQSRPCVSCGELVRRDAVNCDHCGQDMSLGMISRMKAHAGPWYVHEHVRPFPGVTLERLIRQARRGVLNATTIVRGPTTDHQWRFAGETPGLCKYVGLCWNCQAAVVPDHVTCPSCGTDLDGMPGEESVTHLAGNAQQPPRADLAQLSSYLQSAPPPMTPARAAPGRHGRAIAIVVAIVVVFIALLLLVVKFRAEGAASPPANGKAPAARLIDVMDGPGEIA